MATKLSEYIKLHPKQREAIKHIGTGARIFFGGSRGGGKVQSMSSKVCTPKGWTTIGEIEIGDTISCPVTGGSQRVIAIHPQGELDMYRITFDDGATTIVGLDHLWSYKLPNHKRPFSKPSSERDYAINVLGADIEENRWHNLKVGTTKELMEALANGDKPRIPLTEPVITTVNGRTGKGIVDPYILGLLLGDGYLGNITITNMDSEIIEYLEANGWKATLYPDKTASSIRPIVGPVRDAYKLWLSNNHLTTCRAWEKFIPNYIFTAPLEFRVSFLQGLLDSDGYVDERGRCYLSTTSDKLAEGFIHLIRSLGGKAFDRIKMPTYTYEGEKKEGRPAHDIHFYVRKTSALFRLTRKKERCTDSWNGGYENMRAVEKIEWHSREEARCITVSHPLGLYITDDFIVTHNSYLSLAASVIACLQYPKLRAVIVRKTYPELQDNFISVLRDRFPSEVFGYRYRVADKTATFANGSQLIFKSCETEEDTRKVQGIEYQFMVIDEANNFDERIIQRFLGSLRTSLEHKFIPTLLMTGNPGGYADNYFKTRYVRPDYKQWSEPELRHKKKYVFISSRLEDNPSLGEEYADMLDSLPDDLRKAWKDGDWDVFEGQFFNSWNADEHIVDPFHIPDDWDRVLSMDLGYSDDHPTVALFIAQDPQSLKLYVYDEYVGVGSIEMYIDEMKSIIGEQSFKGIYADPSMFYNNVVRSQLDESPGAMFRREGIWLEKANNDRINGWRIVKQWLHWTKPGESKIKFFPNCYKTIETLPTLRFAKTAQGTKREDLDTKMADDAADALRYGLVSGWGYPTSSDMEQLERSIEQKIKNNDVIKEQRWCDAVFVSQGAYYL